MPIYKFVHKLENVPNWYIGTSKAYDRLDSKDPKGFYFLYDTKEVKLRDKNYMNGVVEYSQENPKPIVGAKDRLYLNTDTFEGYVYEDKWFKVFDILNGAETTLENVVSRERASGFDIITVMNHYMNQLKRQAIQKIEWDSENQVLDYTFQFMSYQEKFSHIATKLSFDMNTRHVILSDQYSNVLGTEEIVDLHVVSGHYDDSEKALILTMKNGSNVKIMASALVDIFVGDETPTFITSIKTNLDNTNTLGMDIKLSEARENAFDIKSDGLYFKKPQWFNNPEGKDGYLYTVLNERITIDDNHKLSDIATHATLQQLIDDITAFYELKKQSTVQSKDIISDSLSGSASASLIPTTGLLKKLIGIKRNQKGSE